MSGKPPSVAPRAGAPRVLVYVADPRQLDAGAAAEPPPLPPQPLDQLYFHDNVPHHLPRPRNVYRAQADLPDLRNPPNAIYYKSLAENDNKVGGYGVADNDLVQRTEFFQVNQQFLKEAGLKIEEGKVSDRPNGGKRECVSINGAEFGGIEGQYMSPAEAGELVTYQTRCSGPSADIMPPMQSVAIRQNPNQFDACAVQSDGTIRGDRDLLVGKNYVNYQILEQSVSHQSIVNQSISILNQQVGVSRGVVNEGDSGAPLMLAVLPTQPNEADPCTRTQSELLTITVPLGWRRIITGTSVIYVSPSGTALSNLPQLREYLQTTGTCKCGLPCPLRPETAFSFDIKVASKPYVAGSGAELTKLCNHKRKLLATLQAHAHSPGTPPPHPHLDHKKVAGAEAGGLKKKIKKRPGLPNMSVSQMMVQIERPLNDFKPQDGEHGRTTSPAAEPPQRGAHYLTVSSGWISQRESPDAQLSPGPPGQLVGLGAGYKPLGLKADGPLAFKADGPLADLDRDLKHDRGDAPAAKRAGKEEESQIFCGLNQPLTPEVMQKINEQQQIFIQQNQKQIEMAMKGFRAQLAENSKPPVHNQYVPQAQLVIQNGAVVKTNPAKTPPWQVKRNEANVGAVTSPTPQPLRVDGVDVAEAAANESEDCSGSYGPFPGGERAAAAMCSRVPPLPQHYNLAGQQWHALDVNKRKAKVNNKGVRKKGSPAENKVMQFANQGMRMLQESKACASILAACEETPNNGIPSFMDDPTGYLAQQTALLNNTISRQVGMTSTFEGNQYDGSNLCYAGQMLADKCARPAGKTCEVPNVYRNSTVPNPTPSPNNTPDSSVLSEKGAETTQCCKGCNGTMKSSDFVDNQLRLKYMRPAAFRLEAEGGASSPRHVFDDNPVTSTLAERSPPEGPIQAGTVSTSLVAPPSPSPTRCGLRDLPGLAGAEAAPGPPVTQVMHFISNHNVNKNLMEVDNIAMVGVRPAFRKRPDNAMPGYCPPPHLGGGPAHSLVQACYVQTFVTTVASFSVTRDTVTSVLAGKASTATTSINASQVNFVRPPPPPSVNLATTYAIPTNQPDPFINSVNLPTSYPLHIAGTTTQSIIAKSPLEMVQNVICPPPKQDNTNTQVVTLPARRSTPTTPSQILISSTGQIIVSNNQMLPPPPKTTTAMSPLSGSAASNVSASVTQVVPAVGGVSPLVNQSAVVVNTLPAPFVLQPPMMVDGQVVQQNAVLPQIVAGMVSGQSQGESPRQIDAKGGQSFMQGVAMLSPESIKKRSKKKKAANIAGVLQIAPPPSGNIVVHSSPQHSSPQFSPRGFQLSPNSANISPTPVLQALTIVPGKSGAPAHIVMNGQAGAGNFGSQQIIANTSPSQQINLLQPVNLINNSSGVVPNFGAFQQFIVPNLGGVVMTTDGAAIIQDGSGGVPVQLQLQTVNGQNVLTPVQNSSVFTAGANGGVVIRAQNQQGKILQSQHSPGAQFLSPNGQVVVNGPAFNGQLSPLLANLSPTNVTFNAAPHPVRAGNVQTQEFIQTNRLGQTLVVPLSPKRPAARANSTFVQQNTTIVQQQTTLVANAQLPPDDDDEARRALALADLAHLRHSVSTQTLLQRKSPLAGSPPDTTTHSPLGPERPPQPQPQPRQRPDTTTRSPEPMVQCVSSSEPDDWRDDAHGAPLPRAARPAPACKRKGDFGDGSAFRADKLLRCDGPVRGLPEEPDYDESRARLFSASGSSSDESVQKAFDGRLGSGDAST
ncbi:uncharacterized protein LOC113231948 isoform X2 [Hyposmocoma kahamanoa]|uniref:uncharacterized protein LOC113231948 isoform X2 n=1 Tax=Hyposmocoma kahamanoa TaxID=1477025 RepID=UPI000E6D7203|nr:uncharacterized protein LOC113231948 isoform X2 [Hyposmocoma kahamanoa]